MVSTFLLCAALIVLGRNLVPNVFLILTEPAFYIPSESSLFSFRVLHLNPGSGDWWLYGSDGSHYYAQSDAQLRAYLVIEKDCLPAGFKPLDKDTWGNARLVSDSAPIRETARTVPCENEVFAYPSRV